MCLFCQYSNCQYNLMDHSIHRPPTLTHLTASAVSPSTSSSSPSQVSIFIYFYVFLRTIYSQESSLPKNGKFKVLSKHPSFSAVPTFMFAELHAISSSPILVKHHRNKTDWLGTGRPSTCAGSVWRWMAAMADKFRTTKGFVRLNAVSAIIII